MYFVYIAEFSHVGSHISISVTHQITKALEFKFTVKFKYFCVVTGAWIVKHTFISRFLSALQNLSKTFLVGIIPGPNEPIELILLIYIYSEA